MSRERSNEITARPPGPFALANFIIPLGHPQRPPAKSGPSPGHSPYGNRMAWEALHLLRQLYNSLGVTAPMYAAAEVVRAGW